MNSTSAANIAKKTGPISLVQTLLQINKCYTIYLWTWPT